MVQYLVEQREISSESVNSLPKSSHTSTEKEPLSKEQECKLGLIAQQMEIFRKLKPLPKPTDDRDPDEPASDSNPDELEITKSMYDIVWQDESVAGADLGYRGERIIVKELRPEEDESCPFQWKAYFEYGSLSAIYGCTDIKDPISPNFLGFGDFSLLEMNKWTQDVRGEKPVELEFVDKRDDNDMPFLKVLMFCGWSRCSQICIDAWAMLRGNWEDSDTDREGEQTTLSSDEGED